MSQPIHTTIELSGVKLEVIGTYYPGEDASMDCPGEDESVELDAILTPKGDDISGLIADYMSLQTAVEELTVQALIADYMSLQTAVEELTVQAHKEGVLCAAEDHADAIRKGEL